MRTGTEITSEIITILPPVQSLVNPSTILHSDFKSLQSLQMEKSTVVFFGGVNLHQLPRCSSNNLPRMSASESGIELDSLAFTQIEKE